MSYYLTKNNIKNLNISIDELKSKIEDFNKRDLYLFEEGLRFDISSLIIKKNCIILKIDNIKSVIFEEDAYIMFQKVDYNNSISHYKGGIMQFLSNNQTFHISVFEYLYIITVHLLDDEFNLIFHEFKEINKLEIDNKFIQLQSKLLNLEFRVNELHTMTKELIDNKDDLKEITFNKVNKDEVEKLIENYKYKVEDIYNDIKKLVKEMHNNQQVANIKLAQDRNKIAKINLNLSIISLSLSLGAFVGNMFGMNLLNHLEDNKNAFYIVISLSFLLVFISFLIQREIFKF